VELGHKLNPEGAILGLNDDLGSRPIARSVTQFVSNGLAYLTVP
jgi:hypothetical protein